MHEVTDGYVCVCVCVCEIRWILHAAELNKTVQRKGGQMDGRIQRGIINHPSEIPVSTREYIDE